MKKFDLIPFLIILSFVIVSFFTGCDDGRHTPKAPQSKRLELDSTSRYYDQNYKIYTLEGCEYVVVGYGNQRWGSHKGNCKNPIHTNELSAGQK